jgi:hypothetical protein
MRATNSFFSNYLREKNISEIEDSFIEEVS